MTTDPDPFAEFGAFVPDPALWRMTFTPEAREWLERWDRERAVGMVWAASQQVLCMAALAEIRREEGKIAPRGFGLPPND